MIERTCPNCCKKEVKIANAIDSLIKLYHGEKLNNNIQDKINEIIKELRKVN